MTSPAPRTAPRSAPPAAALPDAPPYGRGSLSGLLPAVAASLGVDTAGDPADAPAAEPALDLPAAPRTCLVLVDGMGELAVDERSGHAPALRRWRADAGAAVLSSGFPSTTATSMGLLGTGLAPGGHGLVGYEVLDPDRDALLNELAWDPAVDPRRWQPRTTWFQRVAAAGVDVTRVAPPHFDGSGLTEAALRGGRFVGTPERLDARTGAGVDALAAAARAGRPALTYVYWGRLDATGHAHGVGSWEWTQELERVDAALADLARRLPRGTLLVVTADHGMVDVGPGARVDVAREPELRAGVRHVGGEPRVTQLYCEPGAAPRVAARWRERLGDRALVLERAEAVAAGWFGDVEERVAPRIGDVLVVAASEFAVVDSARMRPEALRLVGQHGALTDAERLVPLLAVQV
ncbi:alkaline phosphatase family protein [Kineococcus terrestris]|uniref:alkaline phosphatase family protein n=1 Tax=Kineococcus terrestris TaxID=2044856 RepID=UPI0034DAF848